MHRFFSTTPLTPELKLFSGDQFHQIFRVFRAKKGDLIVFFESEGDDVIYEVKEIGKKEASFIKKTIIKSKQKKKALQLFQAYPNKLTTMETIIQKMVEIGVSEVSFFPSEHAQMGQISDTKKTRLQSIAIEALEQSGGNVPLIINYLESDTKTLLSGKKDVTNIIGFPGGTNKIILDNNLPKTAIWIGPEGGWSQSEKEYFIKNKYTLWSFSHSILRLETASIVGAGILNYLLQIEK